MARVSRRVSSSRAVARCSLRLALLALLTASWLVHRRLAELPGNDAPAGDHVWLYYWGHRTSTWWAALTAVLGTSSSCTLAALLLRAVVRHLYARSKVVGALVAVLGSALWLCGAAFLALLCLVVCFVADSEGTQTRVAGPDGRHVLVTESDTGYGPQVDVWRQETSVRFVLKRGGSTVDPRRGPCTVTSSDDRLVLRCGTTSQTLGP